MFISVCMRLGVLDYVFLVRIVSSDSGFTAATTVIITQTIRYFLISAYFFLWKDYENSPLEKLHESVRESHRKEIIEDDTVDLLLSHDFKLVLHVTVMLNQGSFDRILPELNLLYLHLKTLLSNLFEKINTQMTEEVKNGQVFNENELF